MRAESFGSLRNTLGSTSMAVEAGSPVMGHLIITELMALALDHDCVLTRYPWNSGMEPSDRDRLKTDHPCG